MLTTHLRRARPVVLVAALAAAGLGLAAPAQAAGDHKPERLVVRGDATVKDGPCPGGVCPLELTDGTFRGAPAGPGAYDGDLALRVGEMFPNGEGGVCAPIDGRITLGLGSPDRLVLAVQGDSCQDGEGDVEQSSFTGLARFTIKRGTGAYAHARGSGLATFSEDAADHDRMTLIGRIVR